MNDPMFTPSLTNTPTSREDGVDTSLSPSAPAGLQHSPEGDNHAPPESVVSSPAPEGCEAISSTPKPNVSGQARHEPLPVNTSTGPRTSQGKRRSSKNAIRHGFFSKELVQQHMLDKNDRKAYSKLLSDLCEQWEPAGAAELIQIQLMATHLHQYKSIMRLQTALGGETVDDVIKHTIASRSKLPIDNQTEGKWRAALPAFDDLERIERYEAHCLKNYYRALVMLQQLQAMKIAS